MDGKLKTALKRKWKSPPRRSPPRSPRRLEGVLRTELRDKLFDRHGRLRSRIHEPPTVDDSGNILALGPSGVPPPRILVPRFRVGTDGTAGAAKSAGAGTQVSTRSIGVGGDYGATRSIGVGGDYGATRSIGVGGDYGAVGGAEPAPLIDFEKYEAIYPVLPREGELLSPAPSLPPDYDTIDFSRENDYEDLIDFLRPSAPPAP